MTSGFHRTILGLGLLGLCLTLLAPALPAQSTTTEELQSALNAYRKASQEKDVEGILDRLYPGLFQILPREQMAQYFEQFFHDPELSFSFDAFQINKTSPPVREADREYIRIDYDLSLTARYTGPADQQTMTLLKESFAQQYGSDQVTYLADKQEFQLEAQKVMIAVREAPGKPWKLLDFDTQLLPLLDEIGLPAKVLQQLKLIE